MERRSTIKLQINKTKSRENNRGKINQGKKKNSFSLPQQLDSVYMRPIEQHIYLEQFPLLLFFPYLPYKTTTNVVYLCTCNTRVPCTFKQFPLY